MLLVIMQCQNSVSNAAKTSGLLTAWCPTAQTAGCLDGKELGVGVLLSLSFSVKTGNDSYSNVPHGLVQKYAE